MSKLSWGCGQILSGFSTALFQKLPVLDVTNCSQPGVDREAQTTTTQAQSSKAKNSHRCQLGEERVLEHVGFAQHMHHEVAWYDGQPMRDEPVLTLLPPCPAHPPNAAVDVLHEQDEAHNQFHEERS